MIKKIAFTNYKAFKEREEIDLRHVTLILGKNSSGNIYTKTFPDVCQYAEWRYTAAASTC